MDGIQGQKVYGCIKENGQDQGQGNAWWKKKKTTIDAEELVPGDILLIESGDLIPADARILEANELAVDESPLTGESVPVNKSAETLEGEKTGCRPTDMLYKGTAVTGGAGKVVVCSIGMETELGSISSMVGEQKRKKRH